LVPTACFVVRNANGQSGRLDADRRRRHRLSDGAAAARPKHHFDAGTTGRLMIALMPGRLSHRIYPGLTANWSLEPVIKGVGLG
jgi:hypothetical protein